MKKIFLSSLCLVFTALSFIACSDDDNGPVIISTNPSVESEGKYTGKWTIEIIQKEEGQPDKILCDGVYDGSITLTASGSYISEVTFDGEKIKEYMADVLTKKYNVAQMNSGGFALFNKKAIVTSETEKDIDMGIEGAIETSRTTADNISLGNGEISASKELVLNDYTRTKQIVTGWKEPKRNKAGKIISGYNSKTTNITTSYTISFVGTKENSSSE